MKVFNLLPVGTLLALSTVLIIGTNHVRKIVGEEQPRLTIAVKQGVEGVALKEIAKKYSEANHIPVEVIELPYDDLYDEELRQLKWRPERSRDRVPPFDVIMVDDPWLYSLVSDPDDATKRRLLKLQNMLAGKEEDFFPKTLAVSTYCPSHNTCSDYYAVPLVANSQLFAYRALDFQKTGPPGSWEQVLEASAKAEREGRIGYVTRIGPGNSIVTDFMPILWAYNRDSFPENPSKGAGLKGSNPAFDALTSLVGTRKNLGGASFDDFDVSAYLQKVHGASMGIVWSAWAMMLIDTDNSTRQELSGRNSSPITMSDHMRKLRDSLLTEEDGSGQTTLPACGAGPGFTERLTFGKVPLGTNLAPAPELGVWLLAIPEMDGQGEKQWALDFVKFAAGLGDDAYSNNALQKEAAEKYGTPPTRKKVLDDLETEEKFGCEHPSLIPAIRWSLEHGRARPRTPCWKEIETRLGTYLNKMIEQGMDSESFIKDADREFLLFDDNHCSQFLKKKDGKPPSNRFLAHGNQEGLDSAVQRTDSAILVRRE